MNRLTRAFIVLSALVLVSATPALADSYHFADFSGNLNGGSANVKAPFNSVLTQGGPISGHFVFDDQLIPPSGSGFVNVFFSNFPDASLIPPATAFDLDLGGGIQFDLSSPTQGPPAIQYKDGHFNGFFFVSDFLFLGNPYRFNGQGSVFNIRALVNNVPSGSNLVNGHFNVGDANLTDLAVFTPTQTPPTVPEPGSLLLFGIGIALVLVETSTDRRAAISRTSALTTKS